MRYIILFLMSQLLSAAQWPEMSIYHLDGAWKNHNGKEMKLSELAGSPVVVAMVYTSCQHTCPMITKKMQDIRKLLPEKIQKNSKYVLLSFDPEGDTPATLLAYRKKQNLDENWILLTSTDHEIRKVAGVLGVNYKKMPDGGFSHSNIISVLNQNGEVVSKIERLNQESGELVEKLKQLVK